MGAACVLKTPQVVPETPASSRVVGSARGAPVCRPFTPACPIRLLERGPRPGLDSVWRAGGTPRGGAAMLHCEQCGCSGELGMGWVTFVRADEDEGDETPWTGEYCPPCAAARFGYRPTSPRSTSASGNHAPARRSAPSGRRAAQRSSRTQAGPEAPQRRGRRPQTSSFSARHDSELHAGSASPIGTGPTARSGRSSNVSRAPAPLSICSTTASAAVSSGCPACTALCPSAASCHCRTEVVLGIAVTSDNRIGEAKERHSLDECQRRARAPARPRCRACTGAESRHITGVKLGFQKHRGRRRRCMRLSCA